MTRTDRAVDLWAIARDVGDSRVALLDNPGKASRLGSTSYLGLFPQEEVRVEQSGDPATALDAIAALTRVQMAQEQFRSHHGSYALALGALRGAGATSPDGHYEVALVGAHAGGFIARALPRDAALRDSGCGELTVTVSDGVAVFGPSMRCWNR